MIELKRILLPTDFSECSAEATSYACEMADQFESDLHVLHVIHVDATPSQFFPVYIDDLKDKAEEDLAAIPGAEWAKGRRIYRSVISGQPFVEIIRYARENNIDLIVMGTHGRSGIGHILIGSVAERIVRKAPCPVLTIHPEGHEFVLP